MPPKISRYQFGARDATIDPNGGSVNLSRDEGRTPTLPATKDLRRRHHVSRQCTHTASLPDALRDCTPKKNQPPTRLSAGRGLPQQVLNASPTATPFPLCSNQRPAPKVLLPLQSVAAASPPSNILLTASRPPTPLPQNCDAGPPLHPPRNPPNHLPRHHPSTLQRLHQSRPPRRPPQPPSSVLVSTHLVPTALKP